MREAFRSAIMLLFIYALTSAEPAAPARKPCAPETGTGGDPRAAQAYTRHHAG